jgi:spoIIIJ-associated protein
MDDVGDTPRQSANVDEQVKEASAILAQILELMNEKSDIRRGPGDRESLEIEIRGDGSGILIGRHGQTLDALEYLLNRIVARRIKDAMPILLDTESYRARRREQLHRMALSMGERAKRDHAAVKLDPMPPRDRRIVHLALKDDPMITTRSAGEGFLRTVEIVPVDAQRERRGGGRDNRRDRDRERGNERPREPEQRPRERERPSGQSPIGEQGGFKHGQKRLF